MARALVVLMLVLAACAEESTAPPATESPTPEATIAPTEGSPSPELPPGDVECVDATAAGRPEVTIRLVDNEFLPSCVTVLGGQGLKLTNRGAALHNFSVDGSDVDIDIPPGETVRTEPIVTAVPAGTHVFFCEYHRAGGMEGEITVSEAG